MPIPVSTWHWRPSATASCWRASARSFTKNGLRGHAHGPTLRAMAEEPIAFLRAAPSPAARTIYSGGHGFTAAQVRFERAELNRILTLYGRMVSAGEWRDYAIDFLDEVAVFSIFRRTSEMPLFRVEKRASAFISEDRIHRAQPVAGFRLELFPAAHRRLSPRRRSHFHQPNRRC